MTAQLLEPTQTKSDPATDLYGDVGTDARWPATPGTDDCPDCGTAAVNAQGVLDCPDCDWRGA